MNNSEILERLDAKVACHTEAKKSIINAINRSNIRHHNKYILRRTEEDLIEPAKLLLIGQSGTGKTFLVEEAAKIMDAPLVKIDATKLGPSGSGNSMTPAGFEEHLRNKAIDLVNSRGDKYFSVEGAMDRLIVFVDEVDKLCNQFESSGNWNKQVQSSFLTIFEQSGVTFIFAGAFSGLTTKKEAASSIGFFKEPAKIEQGSKISSEDLIRYGILAELAGRFSNISQLDELTVKEYIDILENNVLPRKNKDLSCIRPGLRIELSTGQRHEMAAEAVKSGQGVRYLKRRLNELSSELEFDNGPCLR